MNKYAQVLIDTGIIVALHDSADPYHETVVDFLAGCNAQLITTVGCVTETMWLLARDWRVQNEFLMQLVQGCLHQ